MLLVLLVIFAALVLFFLAAQSLSHRDPEMWNIGAVLMIAGVLLLAFASVIAR